MKTILIIGSGFIGLPLAIGLLKEGFIVTISTTQTVKQHELEKSGLIAIKFNSNEDEDYLQFINCSYDYIVYALPPSVCKKYDYNSVLQKITSLLAKFESIIFTSSISVYQNNGNLHNEMSTDLILNKTFVLETEKFIIETYCNHYIFRLAGLIGENRHPKFFFKSAMIENSNQVVNLVCGSDVVEIITLSITKNIPFGIYNVCSPEHPTKIEYYKNQIMKPIFIDGTIGKVIDSSKLDGVLNYRYKSIYF